MTGIMEKEKRLMFGKRYQVGNYQVFKYNKVLRRQEVAELRNMVGIPMDERKKLQRAQLPFIKVEAVSGMWAVEFCCNTVMYRFLDMVLARAIEAEENGTAIDGSTVDDFAHIFGMMFMDTTVLGDVEYRTDKGKAVKAYLDRQKAVDDAGAEEKAIEELKAEEDASAAIIDMANQIRKEDGDGKE